MRSSEPGNFLLRGRIWEWTFKRMKDLSRSLMVLDQNDDLLTYDSAGSEDAICKTVICKSCGFKLHIILGNEKDDPDHVCFWLGDKLECMLCNRVHTLIKKK